MLSIFNDEIQHQKGPNTKKNHPKTHPELVTIPVEPWRVFLLNLWMETWEPWPGKTVIRHNITQIAGGLPPKIFFRRSPNQRDVFFHQNQITPNWLIRIPYNNGLWSNPYITAGSIIPHMLVDSKISHVLFIQHVYPTSPTLQRRIHWIPNLWWGQGGQLL